ncbi:MAG: fatty acid desaturase [Sandaracinaceae bacterium]|nr:fatty acid desaturase [Sandaracinaceae bacterium]
MSSATIDSTATDTTTSESSRKRLDTWLLHHHADRRQVGIVTLYLGLVFAMYLVPACRNVPMFLAACYLSFLNAVVIHNHLHKGIFKSKALNRLFRCALSFGALYPASANIASHNLVHHHFDDDGQPDWAAPENVSFRWHLLNLIHFPNVVGPNTFNGVSRWALTTRQADFRQQYLLEQVVAFGLTGAMLVWDFWPALFFVVLPQLWGARGILRINLIQHDACDVKSDWDHSRNFVGGFFNWVMCNNGYHTIHHNRAGLHWSVLAEQHRRECVGRMDPRLDEPSMVLYLLRTFVLRVSPPEPFSRAASAPSAASRSEELASREVRKERAEADANAD